MASAIESDARSASKPDQAEREAVGERAVEPAGHRHWLLAADQRTQGPAKRWPDRAFSSNPLSPPGQLSLVTFFFARKESYPPPGRRSTPENPKTSSKRHSNPALCKARPTPKTDKAVDLRQGKQLRILATSRLRRNDALRRRFVQQRFVGQLRLCPNSEPPLNPARSRFAYLPVQQPL